MRGIPGPAFKYAREAPCGVLRVSLVCLSQHSAFCLILLSLGLAESSLGFWLPATGIHSFPGLLSLLSVTQRAVGGLLLFPFA